MNANEFSAAELGDLEDVWAAMLAAAEAQARAAGRSDIAEYLALRKSNDFLRKTACDWLFATFRNIAGEMNRAGASLEMSNEDNYQFKVGSATMMGQCLRLETGVRQLMVKVGWPRVPRHGFIRGGGLALGQVQHRGIKSASEELRLVKSASGSPQWIVDDNRKPPTALREANIRQHVIKLLDYTHVEPK